MNHGIERVPSFTELDEIGLRYELAVILGGKPRHMPVNEERIRLLAMVDHLHALALGMAMGDEQSRAVARRLLMTREALSG